MRQITVEEQIEAIEKATEIACKSKESALRFLKDAGILPLLKKPRKSRKRKQS